MTTSATKFLEANAHLNAKAEKLKEALEADLEIPVSLEEARNLIIGEFIEQLRATPAS